MLTAVLMGLGEKHVHSMRENASSKEEQRFFLKRFQNVAER